MRPLQDGELPPIELQKYQEFRVLWTVPNANIGLRDETIRLREGLSFDYILHAEIRRAIEDRHGLSGQYIVILQYWELP